MANSQGMAVTLPAELMKGIHAFGTTVVRAGTGADTFKASLYLVTASISGSTAAYTATGEVSGTNYSAGGVSVTNATAPSTSGSTGLWTPSASIVYSTVTLATPFDCMLLYNSTQSNKAVGAFTFGSQVVTASNLTITMPANTSSTALVRFVAS